MKRSLFLTALLAAAVCAAGAQQQASQSNPYQGVSTPPPDDTIVVTTDQPTPAKPPAGHLMQTQTPAKTTAAPAQQATPANLPPLPAATSEAGSQAANGNKWQPGDGTDAGIVKTPVAAMPANEPALQERDDANDPDGGIVHVPPAGPGVLIAGTAIRVQLLNDLSSSLSTAGEPFRSRVATDVLSNGQVLIPAGSEIDGQVAEASMGGFAGHGTLVLRPEKVVLPNGQSYALHAMVVDAPDSNTTVGAEGEIRPGSRLKRDGIEYGGAVGAGAVAGAYLGGPVGALAGSAVGAGVVTTHLLVSHPQTHLDTGAHLILTLTQRMHLEPQATNGD
ncbi:MAG TPA: hypothetical protein VFU55_02760 [Terracidiphilus sp.]|nr:hypothetical protein [Terracidiphilus sp.]